MLLFDWGCKDTKNIPDNSINQGLFFVKYKYFKQTLLFKVGSDMKCLSTYNERQRRQYLASKADSLGCHGVSLVCEAVDVCRDTLYRGRYELDTNANDSFPKERIRAVGGGRTSTL